MSALPLLTSDPVYQQIKEYHSKHGADINIKQLFEKDSCRFAKYR